MKQFKKIAISFSIVFLLLALIGCATTQAKKSEEVKKAVLIEHSERMFWEIKTDKASIFVLGTIHVADKNFYPIEEKILNKFDSADRLVSELGGVEEIKQIAVQMNETILKSVNLDPKKNLKNFLTEKDIQFLVDTYGEQMTKGFFLLDPWVLNSVLMVSVYQKAGLNPQEGLDPYFIARAGNKKIEALESADTQIEVLKIGTFEEQLDILKETIVEINNPNKSIKVLENMKKAYLSNSKDELAKIIKDSTSTPKQASLQSQKKFIDALFKDRNIVWAKKFEEYLNKGGTTFIFAGTGHFIGDESVFVYLRKNGILE